MLEAWDDLLLFHSLRSPAPLPGRKWTVRPSDLPPVLEDADFLGYKIILSLYELNQKSEEESVNYCSDYDM